jgi:hypothetical protein
MKKGEEERNLPVLFSYLWKRGSTPVIVGGQREQKKAGDKEGTTAMVKGGIGKKRGKQNRRKTEGKEGKALGG